MNADSWVSASRDCAVLHLKDAVMMLHVLELRIPGIDTEDSTVQIEVRDAVVQKV